MIKQLATDYSITELCSILEVSRSGYYAWRDRKPSSRALEDKQITERIQIIHENSRGTYGYIRVTMVLKQEGLCCGKKRVARLMREQGLSGSRKARFRPQTTDSNHNGSICPNRLRSMDEEVEPNRIWVSDITYIPTSEGWSYLAAIMDLKTRNIKGWSLKDTLEAGLVCDAFSQAIFRYRPDPGLIMHSDRGSQYASHAFGNLLNQHQVLGSMSAKGNCYDNAAMESFWATLKNELDLDEPFQSKEQAQRVIFEYIEIFYNQQRLHSSIGYQSPLDYERKIMRENRTP